MTPLRLHSALLTLSLAGSCLLSSGCSQSVVNDYGPGSEGIQVATDSGQPLLGDWVRMDDSAMGAIVRFEHTSEGLIGTLVYAGDGLAESGFATGQIKIRDLQTTDLKTVWTCRSRYHEGGGWGRCASYRYDDVRLQLSENQFLIRGADRWESQRWARLDKNSPAYTHLLFGLCELATQRADYDLLAEAANLLVPEKEHLTAAQLNAVAWDLATAADSRERYPQVALELALEACRKDEFEEANYVDTLAAAYAAVGNWKQAVKYQQQVCDDGWVDGAQARLILFRQKTPYRQGMDLSNLSTKRGSQPPTPVGGRV